MSLGSFFGQFAHPWILIGMLLIPVYLWKIYIKKLETSDDIPWSILENVSFGWSWKVGLYKILPILRSLLFGLLLLALARPQNSFSKKSISGEGIDIMIALDLSLSMLSKDFEPDRLTSAKRVIKDFIEKREGDRIGLTAFAGESYTACPLTQDYRLLSEFVDNVTYGQIKDGTAIGMGISNAVNRLEKSTSKSKIIILVTDGSNNMGMVKPKVAAQMALEFGIKIYTIGVGTNGFALTPGFAFKKMVYRKAKVTIDENLLTEIAVMTGGKYYRATDESELSQIYNEIDRLEKSEIESTLVIRKEDKFFGLLVASLILMIFIFISKMTIFRNIQDKAYV